MYKIYTEITKNKYNLNTSYFFILFFLLTRFFFCQEDIKFILEYSVNYDAYIKTDK